MNTRKCVCVFFLFIVSLLFFSCQINKDSEIDEMDSILISNIDNKTPKERLITKEYQIETTVDLLNLRISDFNKQYNIECLRSVSRNTYYSIIKNSLGGYVYVLFERDGKFFISTDVLCFEKPVYMSDFKEITLYHSTLDDVRTIDKYGYEMFGMETGRLPFSTHQTADGYSITITYNFNDEETYIVSDIQFSESSDIMYKKLLPIDVIDE